MTSFFKFWNSIATSTSHRGFAYHQEQIDTAYKAYDRKSSRISILGRQIIKDLTENHLLTDTLFSDLYVNSVPNRNYSGH